MPSLSGSSLSGGPKLTERRYVTVGVLGLGLGLGF